MGRCVFLFMLALFCQRAISDDNSSLDNVFGTDDRKPVLSAEYPWSTIGRLDSNCTATLVAPNLVVTAAHCVIDPVTKKLKSNLSTFSLNMVAGRSLVVVPIDQVWWGTTNPDENRAQDWAICRLMIPIGDRYGWMAVVEDRDERSVTLAGYSEDFANGFTASTHLGCPIHEWPAVGMLLHACDMRPGSSGGPMFRMVKGAAQLLAVNVAERRNGGKTSLTLPSYVPENANIGVAAAAFLPTLQEILKKP